MDPERKPKLLVVDDEPEILAMIMNHFSLRGFDVFTAPDGGEGLEAVERERPDVVLLDLKMRRVDGDRFLEELKKKRIGTKVLVITGYQDERLRERVEKLGVDGFLEKPASILEIQRRVKDLAK